MEIITDDVIHELNIPWGQWVAWVEQAFLLKKDSDLPHKISQTFDSGRKFVNTMPAILPSIGCYGVKIVSRYPERNPSIDGHMLLYSLSDGVLKGIFDAAYLTAARTGAVAALAARVFQRTNSQIVSILGLGATGMAFLNAYFSDESNRGKKIRLLRYKGHAEAAKAALNRMGVNDVEICNSPKALITDSDVVVSAVTFAGENVADESWFKPGVVVIPIHTRGFQNCDLVFDKVFADDRDHVKGFANFANFRAFGEIDRVLRNEIAGRESDSERILSYNIGVALHDVYIGEQIWSLLHNGKSRQMKGCSSSLVVRTEND